MSRNTAPRHPTARKYYTCTECRKGIYAGDRYCTFRHFSELIDALTVRLCEPCCTKRCPASAEHPPLQGESHV